jgi:hypothetical protein
MALFERTEQELALRIPQKPKPLLFEGTRPFASVNPKEQLNSSSKKGDSGKWPPFRRGSGKITPSMSHPVKVL